MVAVREVLELVVENTRRTGFPVPIDRREVFSWADGLGLPRSGEYYLYTGALYQLVPYINSLVRWLEGFEKRRTTGRLALRVAKAVSKALDLSKIVRPDPGEVEVSRRVLRSIARLLSKSGVSYGYLYERDGYSGILLYDLGFVDVFAEHAGKVYKALREAGARKVLTIDPHTTHALRTLYPKYVDGYDLEVYNYLELLAEKGIEAGDRSGGRVVIHDPCYYARYEDVLEQPRVLLRSSGYEVVEPRRTGRMTYCCGGPVEALSPALARRVAETRLQELAEKSDRVVTLCPICYANLSRVAGGRVVVRDIALYLAEALGLEE